MDFVEIVVGEDGVVIVNEVVVYYYVGLVFDCVFSGDDVVVG